MITKLDTLKQAYNAGDTAKAISIAARFQSLGDERSAILDAHMAITNPRFVTQLGKSPSDLITAGVTALIKRYSLSS